MNRSALPVVTLVVLTGLVMLAFRPVSGSSRDDRMPDGDDVSEVRIVEPQSPFPLLALWSPADWRDSRKLLQPVDPLTLEPQPGYEPLELDPGRPGGYIEQTVSPDGTQAVFVSHTPGELQARGQALVHLVDLAAWEVSFLAQWETPFGSSNPARPRFSADGKTLYWFEREPLVFGEWRLIAYDVDSSATRSVATLPADFSIHEYREAARGDEIAVLGVRVQKGLALPDGGSVSGEYTLGSAEVLLINVSDGSIEETLELDGVVAGSLALTDLEGDGFPVHNVFPGVAWSDAGSRLYVAHADDSRLTIVDLERRSVDEQFELAGAASILDRLSTWLMPSAQAVARQFSLGHVAVLGDGERLVVAMNQERLGLNRTDVEALIHSPVRLVDIEDGDVLWEAELGGVRGLMTTPEGRHVLAHTYPRILPFNAEEQTEPQRLTLLDGATGEIVRQVDLPGYPTAILDASIQTNNFIYIRISGAGGSETLVIDPLSLEVVGGWQWEEGESSIFRLIPLP